MQSEAALRQAVEEQLDLILKIQEERKVLKKENKLIKEEYHKMLAIVKRTQVQKGEAQIQTEEVAESPKHQEQVMVEVEKQTRGSQTDPEIMVAPPSKLSSAQLLLKAVDQSQTCRQMLCSKCEERYANTMAFSNEELRRKTDKIDKPEKSNKNEAVSQQILRMAKEMASLKRQIKETTQKSKTKDKQIKDLKRCLQVKSQALQKSRKEFNELSNLMNTDKYKSVRNLESELTQQRIKLAKAEEQAKLSGDLRSMLQEVTHQYSMYRQEKEAKVEQLLGELRQQYSRCEDLSRQVSMRQ